MKLANRLKIAAEVVTGLWLVFMLYHQMDEMPNGGFSLFLFLLNLFITLGLYGLLMCGAWKIPRLGLVLIVLGIGACIIPMMFGAKYSSSGYALGIMAIAPLILAGSLFLIAAWKTSKATK